MYFSIILQFIDICITLNTDFIKNGQIYSDHLQIIEYYFVNEKKVYYWLFSLYCLFSSQNSALQKSCGNFENKLIDRSIDQLLVLSYFGSLSHVNTFFKYLEEKYDKIIEISQLIKLIFSVLFIAHINV